MEFVAVFTFDVVGQLAVTNGHYGPFEGEVSNAMPKLIFFFDQSFTHRDQCHQLCFS